MIDLDKNNSGNATPQSEAERQAYFNGLYQYAMDLIFGQHMRFIDAKNRLVSDKGLDEQTAQVLIDNLRKQIEEAQRKQQSQASAENLAAAKKKKRWIAYGVVAVIAAIIIYNLPYFKEMRTYDDVVDTNTINACATYLEEYPEGRHADDVLYLKTKLGGWQMNGIVEYLQKYPEGKYSAELNKLCDDMWDNEIAKYEQRDKTGYSVDAVNYMSEMLRYMKEHRINKLVVNVNPTLQLKDYTEYSQDVRDFMESENEDPSKPLASYMVSLKENFTNEDNENLIDILVDGVQKSFNKIFTEDFIQVVKNDNTQKMAPKLQFNYTIKSQEYPDAPVPHIWTYTDGETNATLNYLIGISISFDAHFTIPDRTTSYDYHEIGEPEDDINNVDDIKNGYRMMTSICFAKFSNKMSDNLGLAEVYFQGDEQQ